MGCDLIRTEDGQTMIVCSRGRQPRPKCSVCQARPSRALCDAVLPEQLTLGMGGWQTVTIEPTCSKRLCAQCSIHVEPDTDFCPAHAPAEYAERAAQILAEAQRGRRR
jgi:hypothetical protein